MCSSDLNPIPLLSAEKAADGIRKMQGLGLLKLVLPELEEGVGMGQNKHHIYTVFEHNLKSLEYAAKNGFPLELRLASLLHDVGKPRSKRGDGPDSTFYGRLGLLLNPKSQLRHKTHRPHQPQRVLLETFFRIANGANNFIFQIILSAIGINHRTALLVAKIHRQSIHRKIPPA